MPYKAKGKCVYKKDTGKKVGCTKGSVKKYLAALHANVPDATTEEIKKPMKKIKLSEIAKKVMEERDWLNNPAIERDFEKSDVSPEEYERERLGRYGRGGGYSGGYSSAPNMVGITFFDVPSGKEEEARKVGLTQLKSGKWGFKHRFDPQVISVASDREKSTVSAAESIFGKGRYWEPKK